MNLKTGTGPQIRLCIGKRFFLFLNHNICCGYSKHMFELMDKTIITILRLKICKTGPVGFSHDEASIESHCSKTKTDVDFKLE